MDEGCWYEDADFRWGTSSGGGFFVHPDSAPGTSSVLEDHGCCGLRGATINRLCRSGHGVGTEVGECGDPHFLLLHGSLVSRQIVVSHADAEPIHLVFDPDSPHDTGGFCLWLHGALDVAGHYDVSRIDRLLDEWGSYGPASTSITWLRSAEARSLGATPSDIAAAFQNHRGRIELTLA